MSLAGMVLKKHRICPGFGNTGYFMVKTELKTNHKGYIGSFTNTPPYSV